MGSLSFSELATIAVIVLIVFGPRRLPELSRRAGVILAKVRDATRELREELREEYGDTIEPLQEVGRDLAAARDQLAATARSVADELRAAGDELAAVAREAGEDDTAEPNSESPLEDVREKLRAARGELDEEAAGAGEVPPDTQTDEAAER